MNHRGLERSQDEGVVCHIQTKGLEMNQFCSVCKGLEMSHLHQFPIFLQRVLKGVQCIVLKAYLALALADLSSLYGARGDISCNRAESPDISPLSMSWGLMKADSDWCLILPVGEESSEWDSTDDSLDGIDAGEYDGDLGEQSHWGDGNGDEGGVWCVLGSSNNMDLESM